MANSIGIVDKNYRGQVKALVDNISDAEVVLQEGACYFQIVSFSGILPKYQIGPVDTNTTRGEGGFGSTTNNPDYWKENEKWYSRVNFEANCSEAFLVLPLPWQ